jgi:hypothetical protein
MRHQTKDNQSKRSLFLTIMTLTLFACVVWGIFAIWRHVGHDLFLILSVIVPAGVVAVFLLLAALKGTKQSIKETFAYLLELLFYWWP